MICFTWNNYWQFRTTISIETCWKIVCLRKKKKTNCFSIMSFPWSVILLTILVDQKVLQKNCLAIVRSCFEHANDIVDGTLKWADLLTSGLCVKKWQRKSVCYARRIRSQGSPLVLLYLNFQYRLMWHRFYHGNSMRWIFYVSFMLYVN